MLELEQLIPEAWLARFPNSIIVRESWRFSATSADDWAASRASTPARAAMAASWASR